VRVYWPSGGMGLLHAFSCSTGGRFSAPCYNSGVGRQQLGVFCALSSPGTGARSAQRSSDCRLASGTAPCIVGALYLPGCAAQVPATGAGRLITNRPPASHLAAALISAPIAAPAALISPRAVCTRLKCRRERMLRHAESVRAWPSATRGFWAHFLPDRFQFTLPCRLRPRRPKTE
jgi:hypothetical protein